MESKETKKWLAYIIMGILTIAGIYGEFAICLRNGTFQLITELIVTVIVFALIFIYAVSNYKEPHGNLLRYLFLAFSFMCLTGILGSGRMAEISIASDNIYQLLRGIAVIISTYIAGRLDRIKANTILIAINAIILLATSIMNIVLLKKTGFTVILFGCSFFILWLDLAVAYGFRYREHKEAGLADK